VNQAAGAVQSGFQAGALGDPGSCVQDQLSDVRRGSKWRLVTSLGIALLVGLLLVQAQDQPPIVKSKFTFGRIRFTTRNFGWFGRGGQGPPWSHDYPRGEQHLMKIVSEVTKLDVNPDGHIVSFDSDEPFDFPIAYLCEAGFMDLTEKEVVNIREYLLRGGFLIVDDFRGERDLYNFRSQMSMVFPDRPLEEIPRNHPIFTCFYDISNLLPPPPYAQYLTPRYLGISDDHGRLMMVVNYNNDISEYWEWSDSPFMPIEQTNEAYKYGVNYVMYALTH
jgi:hypothetical protein